MTNLLKKRIKAITKRVVTLSHIDDIIIFLLSLFSHKKIDIDVASARNELNDFSAKPIGECYTENEIGEPTYDLQIIVPAYNAEKYLDKCMNSIIEQKTRFSFKITLIDDGSTDSTCIIADQYSCYPNIEIIHQENRGFSGARNRGLSKISARYIAFVDSDDMLCPGAIEALMSAAEKENAAIVQGGHISLYGGVKKIGKGYDYSVAPSSSNQLTGYPWAKIFRSDIFKSLKLPENYWFEDTIFSFLIYPKNYESVTIPETVYTYLINPQGISNQSVNFPKSVDSYWITELMLAECERFGIAVDAYYYQKVLGQILLTYKRTIKMPTDIKRAIFELSSELITKYFSEQKPCKKHKRLDKALRSGDFGAYSIYCKYKIRN